MCLVFSLLDGKAILKRERIASAVALVRLAFFLARALFFLPYHFSKAENEVSLERKRKVEDEKPFKDVAGTENDVRSSPLGLVSVM